MAAAQKGGTPSWKKRRDPLWRGDSATGLTRPEPAADPSIVRHILYLGGVGRPTPYHSTTESAEVAQRFAGSNGAVYRTTAPRAERLGVGHISRVELQGLLRGRGQGRARWHSAFEVMQARRYVEQWAEHLLDFSGLATETDIDGLLSKLYE